MSHLHEELVESDPDGGRQRGGRVGALAAGGGMQGRGGHVVQRERGVGRRWSSLRNRIGLNVKCKSHLQRAKSGTFCSTPLGRPQNMSIIIIF